MTVEVDPEYVAARRVLLDALTALKPHGDAIVLVGAQAVYLHTGSGDLAIAPFTTDGDLVLDPDRLGEIPELEAAMGAAGFICKCRPVAILSRESGWRRQRSTTSRSSFQLISSSQRASHPLVVGEALTSMVTASVPRDGPLVSRSRSR